jgi:uncharacterized protein (DUF488 family)
MPLLTVGHGPEDRHVLGARLSDAGVELVVDVRRFPGSRSNPDVHREALTDWLPGRGIGYRWEADLGGRRRLPAGKPVADGWWTVDQFAAYAAYTRTAEFALPFERVLSDAAGAVVVAVMCSESVWWRCHRRLIADVAVLSRDVPVTHLMPDGRLAPHRPSAGAVLGDGGLLYWPARTA